jgi:hypothetical protein
VDTTLISDLDEPTGIAISGDNLYLTETGNGVVGEYKLSGSTVDAELISGLDAPDAIAIASDRGSTQAMLGLSALGFLCLAHTARKRGRPLRWSGS